jgi:hypothetical protein
MARYVGRLSVGGSRYGAPQLQLTDGSFCAMHTSPLGHVYPPHALSHAAGTAQTHRSIPPPASILSAWHAAPETHVPPQVGYVGSPPHAIGMHEGEGGTIAHRKPFPQSRPPPGCPHGAGAAQLHPIAGPPPVSVVRSGRQAVPLGHAPPHTGGPGLPHGVLPTGRHTQLGKRPGPTPKH